MSEAGLRQFGPTFGKVVLENELSPDCYFAILLDLGGMPENLLPALTRSQEEK